MARPTKLNATIQSQIVFALGAGNYFDAACEYAGISRASGFNWMKRGREELERRENPRVKEGTEQWDHEQIYVDFFDAVTRASAQVEVATIAEIRRSGIGISAKYDEKGNLIRPELPPDWRALSWFMEHRYPQKWGKQVKEYQGTDGGPIKWEEVMVFKPDEDDGNDPFA